MELSINVSARHQLRAGAFRCRVLIVVLSGLPVDTPKVGQSFIRDMLHDKGSRAPFS
jgi:hypothetical protein